MIPDPSLPVAVGADVDQQRPGASGLERLGRCEADDVLPGFREQVIERASSDAGSHTTIIWCQPPAVHR